MTDELYEALGIGIRKGLLEAVCPRCGKVVPNKVPDIPAMCGGVRVDPEDIIYRHRETN